MATTTLTLGITSDISSNTISISESMTVTTDGTTGVTEATGVARKLVGTSDAILIDIDAAAAGILPLTIVDKKAVLYIKNLDATFTDYVDIKVGNVAGGAGEHSRALRIYGGQFAVLPLDTDDQHDGSGSSMVDIYTDAASADTLIEYALFYEA